MLVSFSIINEVVGTKMRVSWKSGVMEGERRNAVTGICTVKEAARGRNNKVCEEKVHKQQRET